MVLAFAAGIFFTTFSLTSGVHGVEIAVLLGAGIVGGALVRALVRENLVAVIFVLVVVAECVILSQSAGPWSTLWPVLIPGNAIGVMVGAIVRETLRESRPRIAREVLKNPSEGGRSGR
jgi:CHASE2 domain-containing sensor protein